MHQFPGDVHRPARSRLAGTGRLADDVYLIAHHELTGRPFLPPRALGAGVAGGLLAELIGGQPPAITLRQGHVIALSRPGAGPLTRYARPDDPVAQRVLDQIVAEAPARPLREWLLFLGQTAPAEVSDRLERSGYLRRPASRLPWRPRRPVPGDPDWAHCALLRAHSALDPARPQEPYAACLAGLVTAAGLGFRLANLMTGPGRAADEAARSLPPVLRELTAHVQVTADTAVIAHRG